MEFWVPSQSGQGFQTISGSPWRSVPFNPPDPADSIFSSKTAGNPGIGFPSACKDLVIAPRSYRDANGYYETLGVAPWATKEGIQKAYRALARIVHPDGTDPDPEEFMRLQEIYEILSNEKERVKYDNVPPGSYYVDSVVKQLMKEMQEKLGEDSPFADAMPKVEFDTNGEVVKPPLPKTPHFDYYSEGHRKGDLELSQAWYKELMEMAPGAGFKSVVKVFLCNQKVPQYLSRSGMFSLPRKLKPSPFTALLVLRKAQNQ